MNHSDDSLVDISMHTTQADKNEWAVHKMQCIKCNN